MGVLVLLGPPGSGKGTTAVGLAANSDFVHFSTGDVLRKAMRDGTEMGRAISPFMDAGRLVPDELVMQIVVQRLQQCGSSEKVVLDGFPRTCRQAEKLDEHLQADGEKVKGVFLLEAEQDVLVRRLLGRLTCLNCRSIFHLAYLPAIQADVCDRCGEKLYQRDDDVEATIQERIQVYRKETEPLVAYYQERGVLVNVPATGEMGETVHKILRTVETA